MENRAIADPLLRFIETQSNGLFLGGFPTGIGKTHQCCWMMLESIRRNPGNRFIFITDQRKNLPEDQLSNIARNEFGMDDEQFRRTVLVMKSNVDSFTDRYTSDMEILIKESFREYGCSQDTVTSVLSDKRAYERSKSIHDPRSREFARRNFAESERVFRKEVRRLLAVFSNREQRLMHIREDPDLTWISELYPSVFFDEYPIVVMTVKKFMYDIDTLVSAPFTIWLETDLNVRDGTSRLRGRTVVIDEFDTAKGEILDVIIDSRRQEVDALRAFRILRLKLSTWRNMPRKMLVQTDWWDEYRPQYSIEQRFEGIMRSSDSISERFHTDYLFRMKRSDGDSSGSSFLFKDYEPYTVGTAYTMRSDEQERYNYITTGDRLASRSNWFSLMFSDMDHFFNRFAKLVRDLALNYQNIEEDDRDKGSFEDCVRSVLDAFDLGGDFYDFILGKVLHNRLKSHNDRKFELAEPTFYSRGFSYISLRDSKDRMLQTHLFFTEFDITPEMVLRHLCESTKVIGLSATGTIDTPVSNFCVNYLRQVGVNIFSMTDREVSGIRELMDSRQHGFLTGDSNVSVEEIGPGGEYSLDSWDSVFGDIEDAESAYRMVGSAEDGKGEEACRRYLRLAEVSARFMDQGDIRSMIAFFSAHVKASSDSSFRRDVSESIIRMVAANRGLRCRFIWSDDWFDGSEEPSDVYFVQVIGDDFNERTDLVSKLLSSGKKVMVLTAYQTLGAGQNIQYEIPVTDENLVWIRGDGLSERSKEKDFDAVYLDKPTSVVSPVEYHDKASLDGYLFFAESMDASDQILMADKRRQVGQAFRSCYTPDDRTHVSHFKETSAYRLAAARVIIQALGRLSRTGWKPPVVRIFADRAIRYSGIFSMPPECYGDFRSFEFSRLYEHLHEPAEVSEDVRLQTDAAVRLSHNLMGLINDMRRSVYGGDGKAIEAWRRWRDTVLRYPVAPADTDGMTDFERQAFAFGYVKVPEPSDGYWFTNRKDFRGDGTDGLKVSFVHPQPKVGEKWSRVDSQTSGLDLMMSCKDIREFMESQGYATCFDRSERLMSPPLFRNIYKGALGEAVGRFLLEKNGVVLNDVDGTLYEMFDYVTGSGAYVDFKNWRGNIVEKGEETDRMYEKIASKLERCGGNTAYIINVVSEDPDRFYPHYITPWRGVRIIQIPYLYGKTSAGDRFNEEAMEMIRRNENGE